jgi:peptide/nickel transport system substrate-binding protein
VDKLLDQLQRETKPAQEQTSVNALEQVMYTQVPVLALWYGGTWGEYTTAGFTGWPTATNPYAPPAPYGNPPLMIITHLTAA